MKTVFIIVLLTVFINQINTIDNGLGLTPQMGWNSWNHYACDGLNQEVVKQTAQAIVDLGFDKKGYEYINLDDCWQSSRNEKTHEIEADPETFPDGIPALAEFIHGLGLKFGLYSDAGTKTCAGRPGSLGYEEIDAQTYSKWGVDYLKYDNCHNEGLPVKERYQAMATALQNVERPIFFSLCEWGYKEPWKWAPEMGNSWRTTPDIFDKWISIKSIINVNAGLYKYAGPGGWNDPDMLEVGNGGLTNQQYQVQFAFWALLKAPLLIGCDVTNMDEPTKAILGNQDIIDVNQDKLGKQGFRLQYEIGNRQVWGIPQADGSTVIILWNLAKQNQNILVTYEFIKSKFQEVGYPCNLTAFFSVYDLINQTDLGVQRGTVQSLIEPENIVMFKLKPMGNKFLD